MLFQGGNIFVFIICFYKKCSGHNKIYGVQNKFGVALPPSASHSYGPDVLPLNNSTSLVTAYKYPAQRKNSSKCSIIVRRE